VLHISNESTFGKTDRVASPNDEVIKRPDIDERECLLERLRQQFIGLTRLGHSRRVVVRKADCGCVVLERGLHDFPRVNACLAQRSSEHLICRN